MVLDKIQLPARVQARMSAQCLIQNYQAIRSLLHPHPQKILPMLKANAYGHGAIWVAQTLKNMPDLYGFGVATLDEGARLRASLGGEEAQQILIFSETVDWSQEKGQYCQAHHLTPVLASEDGWLKFINQGWHRLLSYELQFNTGMNRLGIELSFVPELLKHIKEPRARPPQGIFSHLAVSEDPTHELTLLAVQRFKKLRADLQSKLPRAVFHLCNSGGIWNYQALGLQGMTEVVRPGLSLYGIPPWQGAEPCGIRPVMEVSSRVVAIHRLLPGDSIGYGGKYKVQGQLPVMAAIVSAGYADGIPRTVNQGYAYLNGKRAKSLGVISMDLCAIECDSSTSVGDAVHLIGPHLDLWDQARCAATIPYELFTSLSERVERVYE